MLSYEGYLELSNNEKLEYFLSTLSATNRTPEYYVNWDKVAHNTKVYELELHTLNYLVGKSNIYDETLRLFTQQPNLIKAIPSLIASRDRVLDILSIDEEDNMDFTQLNFEHVDLKNIKSYVDFCESSGLLYFLSSLANKSLVDYVYGVESGLDSNARKNRSGTTMEGILERNIEKISKKMDLHHIPQATAAHIKEKWNVDVPVDKSIRRFDEAVFNSKTNHLWIIETNYYGGGGSKLKAVAGEFTTLSKFVSTSKDNVTFVWITDGQGWHTTKIPLSEAFAQIDNIFNLKMIRDGYLEQLFSN